MHRNEFRAFKKRALNYAVMDKELFRVGGKGTPNRKVVDSDEERADILTKLHDESGHKGRESTYFKVSSRYYWENCYKDVKEFVASC